MKVAVTGGGTGGHILPVLAVTSALVRIDTDTKIFFVGSRFGIEAELIPKIGVKYYGISAGKFRRYHNSKILNLIDPTTLFMNIRDLFRFLGGIIEAKKVLAYEKPDVLFAKGGYVSLPVGVAAWILKIPVVIHESDIVMGLSNRIMGRFARKVCVSFPINFYNEISTKNIVFTGNPTREDIKSEKGEAIRRLGLDGKLKTVLIMGGSQGSLFINKMIISIIEKITLFWQVLWISGERDGDLVSAVISKLPDEKKNRIKHFGFVTSEIGDIYAASDIIITRAGSNALFEIAEQKKPAILIPIEGLAGNHQYENAKFFSRRGAAYLMSQKSLTPSKLYHQIKYLLENEEEVKSLSKKISELSQAGASNKVAKIIYNLGVMEIEKARSISKQKE